jgi:hypothetical protein
VPSRRVDKPPQPGHTACPLRRRKPWRAWLTAVGIWTASGGLVVQKMPPGFAKLPSAHASGPIDGPSSSWRATTHGSSAPPGRRVCRCAAGSAQIPPLGAILFGVQVLQEARRERRGASTGAGHVAKGCSAGTWGVRRVRVGVSHTSRMLAIRRHTTSLT